MSDWLGDVPAGSTLPLTFNTFKNGVPITMSGLATGDIKIYKGTSMTQRSSTAGFTLLDTDGIDIDSITGWHGFSLDLSDNTDAGFYAAGSYYAVVVDAITVDGNSIAFEVARFRIVAAENTAGYPVVTVKSGTGTGELNLSSGVIDANVTKNAGTNITSSSGRQEVNVSHFGGSAGTFASGRPEVNTTHFGGSAITQSGGRPEVNMTHAGGTAWASGGIVSGAFASGAITASAIAADAITAAKVADGTIDAATFAAGAINAAAIADGAIDRATFAADTGLVSIRSNTAQAGAGSTITLDASASATDSFYKGATVLLTGGTGVGQYRVITAYVGATKVATVSPAWATNPDNTSTFAILPEGMTDVEAWLGATAPANTGDAYARLGAPAGASVSADIAAVKSDTGAIKTKTDSLTFSVSGQVDANVTNWKGSTAPAMTGDAFARLGAPAGASVSADIAAVKTVDDAIKLKTDNLPSDPADASVIAGRFDTLDTSVGALPTLAEFFTADSGETYGDAVTGSVVKEIADNAGGSALTVQDIVDGILDEATSGHTTAGTVGKAIGDTKSDTDDIQSRLPAALVSGRMDASVGAYQSGQAPLQPTTAGRTLDVSAGGEAGVDWANVGSPSTTVNLSGTTVKTATDVETDTQDIQSRLPAALTGAGNMKSDAIAVSGDATAADNLEAALDGTGGVTITAAVTGNITGNLSGSVGSVTGNVGGNVVGSIGSLATQAKADVNAEADTALADYDAPTRSEATSDKNEILTAVGDVPTNAELATALAAADDAVLAAIAALNNLSAAQVNAEVVDALNTDTYGEPSGVPPATDSIVGKLGRLHMALRNQITVDATAKVFHDDGGNAEWKKSLSDDGSTYTEAEASAP